MSGGEEPVGKKKVGILDIFEFLLPDDLGRFLMLKVQVLKLEKRRIYQRVSSSSSTTTAMAMAVGVDGRKPAIARSISNFIQSVLRVVICTAVVREVAIPMGGFSIRPAVGAG